jgi:hypothetical protein
MAVTLLPKAVMVVTAVTQLGNLRKEDMEVKLLP